jgi:hypothetical protein
LQRIGLPWTFGEHGAIGRFRLIKLSTLMGGNRGLETFGECRLVLVGATRFSPW